MIDPFTFHVEILDEITECIFAVKLTRYNDARLKIKTRAKSFKDAKKSIWKKPRKRNSVCKKND